MRTGVAVKSWIFSLALAWPGTVVFASDLDASLGSPNGWQRYDWLSPTPSPSSAETGGKLTASAGQDNSDPFAVVTSGSLWQEKYGATYTQPLPAHLTLSYETDATTLSESSQTLQAPTEGMADDLSHEQKAGLQFQPVDQFTLAGNLHDSSDDSPSPESSVETRGAGFTAESHLPLDSVLTLGANSDTTTTGSLASSATDDNSYDAQVKQPLGKLPLTAVLKGHYEETTQDGAAVTRLPSLEQSLVWKPADSTTVQMGLRQQHYQNFPGVSNDLNETVFADWSQTVLPEVTWHSYAEVLNTRGTEDLAPAATTPTTGTNGTAQSADPTNNLAVPTSFTDETVTFSTGPSFKVDRDVSASIEYSNRIDHNPQPGTVGQEQRVSVSLKGTF
jgi:hypothetical protein